MLLTLNINCLEKILIKCIDKLLKRNFSCSPRCFFYTDGEVNIKSILCNVIGLKLNEKINYKETQINEQTINGNETSLWTLTKANKETKMNRDRDSDCVRDGDRKQFNIG